MRLIDVDSRECWACTHHATGSCDTFCDYGESFELREDVKNALVIDAIPREQVSNVMNQVEILLDKSKKDYDDSKTFVDIVITNKVHEIYKKVVEIIKKGIPGL